MIQITLKDLREAIRYAEAEQERNGQFCSDMIQIELIEENPNDDGKSDSVHIYLGQKPEYRKNEARRQGYQVFVAHKKWCAFPLNSPVRLKKSITAEMLNSIGIWASAEEVMNGEEFIIIRAPFTNNLYPAIGECTMVGIETSCEQQPWNLPLDWIERR
jgi:hypothetical protein